MTVSILRDLWVCQVTMRQDTITVLFQGKFFILQTQKVSDFLFIIIQFVSSLVILKFIIVLYFQTCPCFLATLQYVVSLLITMALIMIKTNFCLLRRRNFQVFYNWHKIWETNICKIPILRNFILYYITYPLTYTAHTQSSSTVWYDN